jgi:hypothetical protein
MPPGRQCTAAFISAGAVSVLPALIVKLAPDEFPCRHSRPDFSAAAYVYSAITGVSRQPESAIAA